MSDKHVITIEVDRNQLFDMIAATGDGGSAVGNRLAGVLLGDDSAITAIGLGVYGVFVRPDALVSGSSTGGVGR